MTSSVLAGFLPTAGDRPARALPSVRAGHPQPRSDVRNHGTGGYARGCRCEVCTQAKAEYRRRHYLATRPPLVDRSTPLEIRFWRHVDKSGECWLWTGFRDRDGYGRLTLPTARGTANGRAAHRIAYELSVGPIPEGLQIDHLCRTEACVRPDHLEPVTPRENTLRQPRHSRSGLVARPEPGKAGPSVPASPGHGRTDHAPE